MHSPIYISPAGRASRHLAQASLIAQLERFRVSLPAALPPRVGGHGDAR